MSMNWPEGVDNHQTAEPGWTQLATPPARAPAPATGARAITILGGPDDTGGVGPRDP